MYDKLPGRLFIPHCKPKNSLWLIAIRRGNTEHGYGLVVREMLRIQLGRITKQSDLSFGVYYGCMKKKRDDFLCQLDLAASAEQTKSLVYLDVCYEGTDNPDMWAVYFGSLATPSPSSSQHSHAKGVEEEHQPIKATISDDFTPFMCVEVCEVISTLTRSKAAGCDDLDPEHIIFGGVSLAKHLTVLFNAMMASSHIPSVFRLGTVIPILKGRNKDDFNTSNYRGITILSKEKLLIRLHAQEFPPALNGLQGGFRENYSCLHTACVYQVAVRPVREDGHKVFAAFQMYARHFTLFGTKGCWSRHTEKASEDQYGSLLTVGMHDLLVQSCGPVSSPKHLIYSREELYRLFCTVCM